MKPGPERDLLARYMDRAAKAGRSLGISKVGVTEIPESRNPTVQGRKGDESQELIAALPPGASLIMLDETGEDLASAAIAGEIRKALESGVPELAFAIGGPDGHGEAIRSRATKTIRFGRATWPHQIVRIMLTEQLYRAVTILAGHPYHRE